MAQRRARTRAAARQPATSEKATSEKAEPATKPSPGDVVVDLPIWDQFLRIGGAVSPEALSGIIREASGGRPAQLIDLVHEIRQKDGHVHACLATLELEISSLNWTAIPLPATRGRVRRSEQKLAEQVQAAIRECSGWTAMLAHLVGEGEGHGHATAELAWDMYDGREPLLNGWFLPVRAKNIQANRFGFHREDGRLLFDPKGTQSFEQDGVDLLAEYPIGKFVQYRPRINGDIPTREGVDRLIAWAGIFRNHGLRGWLTESENAWKPTRLIGYDKNASSEDIAFAKALARRLTTTGGAAHPKTLDIKVEYPKTGSGQSGSSRFRELEEWLGMELSKAILGHTLLLESGNRGARSLGEVGYTMHETRRDARALALAATVNALVIRPLVTYNSTKRAPLYLPELKGEIDLVNFSQAVDRLARRMRVPAQWVREQGRIPEPKQDDEILTTGDKPGPFGQAQQELPGPGGAEPPPDGDKPDGSE